MNKNFYKNILNLIRENKLEQNELISIVNNFLEYKITKNQVRNIISAYEKNLLKDIGILDRTMSTKDKEEIYKKFNLKGLITSLKNEDKDISQSLKIGDNLYTFNVKDKLRILEE